MNFPLLGEDVGLAVVIQGRGGEKGCRDHVVPGLGKAVEESTVMLHQRFQLLAVQLRLQLVEVTACDLSLVIGGGPMENLLPEENALRNRRCS